MVRTRPREPRPENQYHGCSSVAALFRLAFEQATMTLGSKEVAQLATVDVGDVAALGWMPLSAYAALVAHVDVLAARGNRDCHRLRQPERTEILRRLGGPVALRDGHIMFLLAHALDDRYAAETAPPPGYAHPAVLAAPRRFLAEIANPPPPLGQMTPTAACRRWMRSFWYAGDVQGLHAFGKIP